MATGMFQNGGADYFIDIVMCIDGTGSMSPIIDEVKSNALSFYKKFITALEAQDKHAAQVRIKVIVFRDYECDTNPMEESEFFLLPDQDREFNEFVSNIRAEGGGDIPENALEAIALALKSDWTTGGSKRRHAVLVFTDAEALELQARAGSANYPEGMPKDLGQLGEWWEGLDQTMGSTYQMKAGRLVIFAPSAYPWTNIQAWNRVWTTFSTAGHGLDDVEITNAIELLVGSV